MKFVVNIIAESEQLGEPADPAITGQPIFDGFRQILKDIPSLESAEDLKNFAQRREKLSGTWVNSMQSMDTGLQGNFSVMYLVDQLMHNPKKMESQLLAGIEDSLSLETLEPMLNMLKLMSSNVIGHDELTQWQETSDNAFGQARFEGGKAEVSARAKKAVTVRMENDSTTPVRHMIEKEWLKAVNTPGIYRFKSDFAKDMQAVAIRDHGGITVTQRTIEGWVTELGGTLQRIKEDKS